jgi:acetaldehyde dehydrogenase (acetylating)
MANDIRRGEAILSLKPDSTFILRDNVLEWLDSEQTEPTEAEIDAEVIRLQAVYDSQEYARKRKAKYDALNQFELISDDSINGTTTHKDAIVAIKSEFPKP